jgi:hypothetical protein
MLDIVAALEWVRENIRSHRIVRAEMEAEKAIFPTQSSPRPFDFGRHAELAPWAPPSMASAPAISAKVPLLVGSTRTEFGVGWGWSEFEDFTLDELTGAITNAYKKVAAERALGALRSENPEAKPWNLFAV